MATFENFRLCKKAEFDYFKEERKDPSSLREDDIYIAMLALRRTINGFGVVALPLKITEINDQDISYQPFGRKNKLVAVLFKLTIIPDNYIHTPDLGIMHTEATRGFIRDYKDGLDGNIPKFEKETEVEQIRTSKIPELVYS